MRAIGEAFVAGTAVITGDVRLSKGANVWYGCVIRGDLARISFGVNANLQDGCIVHTDHDEPQTIEDGVVIGHAAILHGRRIGVGSLIGMGARLLSGCEIGEGCIIAAGAIVTEGKVIPPRSLVVGIPGNSSAGDGGRSQAPTKSRPPGMAQPRSRRYSSNGMTTSIRTIGRSELSKAAARALLQGRDGCCSSAANFAWFTGGATAAGCHPRRSPGVYIELSSWLLCCKSIRSGSFDEELDVWDFNSRVAVAWGRSRLLADLSRQEVASDAV